MERYLLDTSAVLTFTDQEEGFERVGVLLRQATAGKCYLIACSITLMEIYYVTRVEEGEDKAAKLVTLVESWPMEWVYPDERTLLQAGKLKANYRLSVADALIAAVAKLHQATLVHKDPELSRLEGEVPLLNLPFKRKG